MERFGVLAVCLLVASPAAAADCTTYVLRLDGQAKPEYLQTEPTALSEIARGTSKLRRVGLVGGHLVYEASTSKLARRLVWDRGDWSFCTALVAAGDESIIVGIHEAKVLRSGNTDVLHVRIQYAGTGHFQESVFLTVVDGVLVHVREDATNSKQLADFFAAHGIRPYHRGLGFCEDSLTEERLFEAEDEEAVAALCIGCRLIVRYKLDGTKLLVESIGFGDHTKDCEMFPEW
jgi:hypothetical protein